MVLKTAAVLVIATAGPAHSKQTVFTEIICLPIEQAMIQLAGQYGEQPLFSAEVHLFASPTQTRPTVPTSGPVLFTVNQTTGSWSLFYAVSQDTACLLASGRGFVPE